MLGSSTIPAMWFGVTLLFPRIGVDALLRSSTIPCRLHRYLECLSALLRCEQMSFGFAALCTFLLVRPVIIAC